MSPPPGQVLCPHTVPQLQPPAQVTLPGFSRLTLAAASEALHLGWAGREACAQRNSNPEAHDGEPPRAVCILKEKPLSLRNTTLQAGGARSQASCGQLYSSQATEYLLSGSFTELRQPPTSAESIPVLAGSTKGQKEKESL